MEDLSFLNFSIRDKTYLKQEDTSPSLSFPALIPTILPKKVIFSSSTSSPVNLPICFYLLPDPPLPHFPYSWWTALQSSPASSSPRTLLMAALSLLFLRTCFPQRGGVLPQACCPWGSCGILPLGYERFPTHCGGQPWSSADSLSLPATHRLESQDAAHYNILHVKESMQGDVCQQTAE